ncbi:hypothetical protein Mal64_28920 [Pseudobythopirellula maris]|uniref:mannan endo-1,4-beta-mannosidase n=1 Tax=Pseudobythopirellula maris TaxID=2527991 RepID=A0A5C5ZLM7_9BACT|nr:cellulase family glycosylhydrolase [Pseudobythopirellula maris]TWT87353.1 hypothetical protein Mal64_28920 [Pseudobythopirellula maris]
MNAYRPRVFLPPVLASLVLMFAPTTLFAQESVFEHFVTRQGDQLFDGDKPVRFVSWNIPNLQSIEDAFSFLGESPWRWPNRYEIADALESTRQMGGTVVRTYVLSVKREGSDMGDHVHVLAPGEFNEEAFRALDLVLAEANRRGVRVFIPLVDEWHWMGGARQYEAFRGKPEGAFWTDPEVIGDFLKTVEYMINRRNTVTGQLYRDDKAIFCWETGNEITSPASWTKIVAAKIKELDANHLVMDGRSLKGVPPWSLEDPNVDIVTTHHYPGPGRDIPAEVRTAIAAAAGKKPYLVGEVGFLPTDEMREIFDDVIASRAVGVLGWSLRFHNRDGGFYAHSEPAAGGSYKAYHWPGFPSGAAYDESGLLELMREKAHAIRGVEPGPLPIPEPAHLLPTDDVARLAWRGSTGATGYHIERAPTASGPWATIAHDVSDAAVYYRPLHADESAVPGSQYFYRVIAKNSAGSAAPSNVVGPVSCEHRVLVDELADDSRYSEASGAVMRRGNARLTQEDSHCLTLEPGASVAYDVPSGLRSFVLHCFTTGPETPVVVTTGAGDPISVRREVSRRDAGDYGYLTPVLITAEGLSGENGRLVIASPEGGETVHLSRVEIRYGDRGKT